MVSNCPGELFSKLERSNLQTKFAGLTISKQATKSPFAGLCVFICSSIIVHTTDKIRLIHFYHTEPDNRPVCICNRPVHVGSWNCISMPGENLCYQARVFRDSIQKCCLKTGHPNHRCSCRLKLLLFIPVTLKLWCCDRQQRRINPLAQRVINCQIAIGIDLNRPDGIVVQP